MHFIVVFLNNFQSKPQKRTLISFNNSAESLLSALPALFSISLFNVPSSAPVAWAELTTLCGPRLLIWFTATRERSLLLRKWRTHTASMWEQECVLAVYLKQRYERVRLWKEHRKICIMNTSSQLSCVTSLIALRLCIQSAYLLVLLNLVQYVRCVRYLKHFSHRIVKRVSFCEASGMGNYRKWMCCPVLGSRNIHGDFWSAHLVDLWGSPEGSFTLSTALLIIHIHASQTRPPIFQSTSDKYDLSLR